jgi:hypothetical protein
MNRLNRAIWLAGVVGLVFLAPSMGRTADELRMGAMRVDNPSFNLSTLYLNDGSATSPSLTFFQQPNFGFSRSGTSWLRLQANVGLGNQAYQGNTYFRIDGPPDDGSGYMFWLHRTGPTERPLFQVRRDGGVRAYDYFLVMPYTAGPPNWNWPGNIDSSNLVVGTDVVKGGSSITVYGGTQANNRPDLLRLYGSVTWQAGLLKGTKVYEIDDHGVQMIRKVPMEPENPQADYGKLYIRDDGTGKSQLVIRFPSGAVQVLATEP